MRPGAGQRTGHLDADSTAEEKTTWFRLAIPCVRWRAFGVGPPCSS